MLMTCQQKAEQSHGIKLSSNFLKNVTMFKDWEGINMTKLLYI